MSVFFTQIDRQNLYEPLLHFQFEADAAERLNVWGA